MELQYLLQLAANGIVIGSVYALLAIGLSLIFGILGVVNFAHGEFYMLGATATYALVALLGLDYWVSIVLVMLVAAAIGIALHDLFLKRIGRHEFERSMLLTLGLAMILQNGALAIWGADPKFVRVPALSGLISPFEVRIPLTRAAAFAAAIAGLFGLIYLLHRTRLGQAMRAVASNPTAASVVGIPANLIARATVAVGLAMCGLAGAALAPIYTVHPLMGTLFVFKAFAIVIIGGMGSLSGAAIVAFALGIVESTVGAYVSLSTTEGIVFAVMIAVLLFRPLGLFGRGLRV